MHTGSEVLTRTGKCVSSPLLLFCWVTCERTDERGVCVCVCLFLYACVCVWNGVMVAVALCLYGGSLARMDRQS